MKVIFELDNPGTCNQIDFVSGRGIKQYSFIKAKNGYPQYLFDGTREEYVAIMKDLLSPMNRRMVIFVYPVEESLPDVEALIRANKNFQIENDNLNCRLSAAEAMLHEQTRPSSGEPAQIEHHEVFTPIAIPVEQSVEHPLDKKPSRSRRIGKIS